MMRPYSVIRFSFVIGALLATTLATAADAPYRIAVTFDDLPAGGPDVGIERLESMTERLLGTLTDQRVPAVGFVNERKLYHEGEIDRRVALLDAWLAAGMELANHTFSHVSLHDVPLARFEDDIIRGDAVTRTLADRRDRPLRYFRHPYLRTGRSLETKQSLEIFLSARGYTIAPVTIENSDWMFAAAWLEARERKDAALVPRVLQSYLEFTESQLDFWEAVTRQVTGRDIPHVLLLHANELNAACLPSLLELLRKRGYRFITLEEALQDPAYARPDLYTGPAGVSWPFRWAHAEGSAIDWREEPVPPDFVQDAYRKSR